MYKGWEAIMLPRVLEPEVMDTEEDAREYEAIPNDEVNRLFAARAVSLSPPSGRMLDMGTGPGHIAILIAERATRLHVTAIDLAAHMLALARRNVDRSSARGRITVELRDVKQTGYERAQFDAVVSNSLVHHIPDPLDIFTEIRRVARSGAAVFVKDLLRPPSKAALDALVERHAGGCTAYQRRLFADSLHAALTVAEVRELCARAGLDGVEVMQTSDRHWELSRTWSPA
jgi:ubiquinone/menaquinone biosynthesis C-methylase UbiE